MQPSDIYTCNTGVAYCECVAIGKHYPNEWARLIDEASHAPGWTQARLAERMGVDRNTLRRYVNGDSTNVTTRTVRAFAEATGSDYDIAARAAAGAAEHRRDDVAIREVMDSTLPDPEKQEIVAYILRRREEAENALRRDIELMLRTRRAAS